MFLWRNKKDMSIFLMKKSALSVAMKYALQIRFSTQQFLRAFVKFWTGNFKYCGWAFSALSFKVGGKYTHCIKSSICITAYLEGLYLPVHPNLLFNQVLQVSYIPYCFWTIYMYIVSV